MGEEIQELPAEPDRPEHEGVEVGRSNDLKPGVAQQCEELRFRVSAFVMREAILKSPKPLKCRDGNQDGATGAQHSEDLICGSSVFIQMF